MANCTELHEKFAETERRMIALDLATHIGKSFLDKDGDICVYLGIGGKRDVKNVPVIIGDYQMGNTYDIDFQPVQHIYAYSYKNEWFLSSFEANPETLEYFYARQPKV